MPLAPSETVREPIQFRPPETYKKGEVLIDHGHIIQRIEELAGVIAEEYRGKGLIVLGILNGSFMVLPHLVEGLHRAGLTDLEVSFIPANSYSGTTPGKVRISRDMDIDPKGRPVLIVDDILDTGKSLEKVKRRVERRNPTSVRTCVLLDKPANRVVKIEADYVGFAIPKIWVQGFGMDTEGIGRADPDIRVGPHDYK